MPINLLLDNFHALAEAPNGVQKLRELIVQIGIQGNLVSHDPNDELASTLLEKIKSEKDRLIKEEKIKSYDLLPPVKQNEIPFALPEEWAWARLDHIANTVQYGYTASADSSIKDVRLLRITDIQNGRVEWGTVPGCSISGAEVESYRLQVGDVLIARTGGTIGKSFLMVDVPVKAVFASYLIRIVPNKLFYPAYLKTFLASRLYWAQLYEKSMGTGQPNVNGTSLRSLLIPIPPFNEQRRIVAKVDQLMALCDELEKRQEKKHQVSIQLNESALNKLTTAKTPEEFAGDWQRIKQNFDLLYDTPDNVGKLKQAILQLAVQGKLVPQDPNDEPASVLLEKIKAEKESSLRGIRQRRMTKPARPAGGQSDTSGERLLLPTKGRDRNDKNLLPPITKDEVPYELPKGWVWARFPELGEFGRGKSKHRPRNAAFLYKDGRYPLVQTGDVARANGVIITYTGMYNDKGLAQSKMWPKGTMCITIAANIADSGILGMDACFPDSVVGFVPSKELGDARYFEYFIRTAKEHLQDFAPSTAQKNINLGVLERVLVPLPPRNELGRVVTKVDELMRMCDELETNLTHAEKASEELVESVVREVVRFNHKG